MEMCILVLKALILPNVRGSTEPIRKFRKLLSFRLPKIEVMLDYRALHCFNLYLLINIYVLKYLTSLFTIIQENHYKHITRYNINFMKQHLVTRCNIKVEIIY